MKITVFTPTYNRAYLLPRLYESLKKQEYSELEWVIMDDGSVDNTKELVKEWIAENEVEIKYAYQENQGRFSAYNNARYLFKGELVLFVDSDDYLLENSISRIVQTWKAINDRDKISGIIGYMETTGRKVLGNEFPDNLKTEKIYILYDKYKLKGDKFLAFRNDLIQKYEYPVFKKERFTGDSIVFNAINEEYPMYLLRERLSYREYEADSITKNILYHHLSSPNGMREHYRDALKHEKYNKIKIFKHCIGFTAFGMLTGMKHKDIVKNTPKRICTIISYPFGILYYLKCKKSKIERKI